MIYQTDIPADFQDRFSSIFCRFLQGVEANISLIPPLAEAYDRLFYGRLVRSELRLADLRKNASLLHVGSGPRPMTAMKLAAAGHEIVGLEMDEKARRKSRTIIEREGYGDRIEIISGDGREIEIDDFEAIWLSLHVKGKESLIRRYIQGSHTDLKIIYRNPAGFLTGFYDQLPPEIFAEENNMKEDNLKKGPVIMGKQSCLLNIEANAEVSQ